MNEYQTSQSTEPNSGKRHPLRVTRRFRRRFLKAAALLGLLYVLIAYVALPIYRPIRAEQLVRQFENEPSQEAVDGLVRMLELGVFEKARGGEVLAMIMRPRITTKKEYIEGRPVVIRDRSWVYNLYNTQIDSRTVRRFLVSGGFESTTSEQGGRGGHLSRGGAPYTDTYEWDDYRMLVNAAPAAGVHEATWTCSYSMIPIKQEYKWGRPSYRRNLPDNLLPIWRKRTAGTLREATYKCDFVLPIPYVVVPSGAETPVEVKSDPALNAEMRAGISSRITINPVTDAQINTPHQSWPASSCVILGNRLPENAFFQIYLRDANGNETTFSEYVPRTLFLRAGEKDEFEVYIELLMRGMKPGAHNCTLILRSGTEPADYMLDMDSVWQGEIEIPVTLVITP